MSKTYNWGTIVPLIGGNTVAGRAVTGEDPNFLLTYKPFADNEKNIRAYLPDVPYHVLDDGGDMDAGKGADFISALCPCAGLSTLGTGTPEMREAANSWMFKTAEHVLGHLKPRVFWGENAPAMYSEHSEKAKSVRGRLQAIAQANGYTMSFYFTSTHLHGVPQRRHRTFYFCWRDTQVPQLSYWKRPSPTWGEYLKQIPADATQHEEDKPRAYKNLRATRFAKYALELHGDSFPDAIRERMRAMNRTAMITVQDYIMRDPADPHRLQKMLEWCKTNNDEGAQKYVQRIIDKTALDKGVWDDSPSIFLPETNFNALIGRTTDAAHPYEHRSLTVRECLHMMALPLDFNLVTKTINHICQNVPVCTASDMQRDVLAYLNGTLPMIDAQVVFQSNFKEKVERLEGESSKLLVF